MPKETITEVFVVTIVSDRPMPNMTDHLAGRIWPMDGVVSVEASKVEQQFVKPSFVAAFNHIFGNMFNKPKS